ncbi:hypothetical protein IAU60_006551 [Kwoniella sp. DSM 27419]
MAIGHDFKPTIQLMENMNEDLLALESIYQCGLGQERLCNDVLSLGRIQLDMLQLFDCELDLSVEACKVVSIFRSEARMSRIALSATAGANYMDLGVSTVKADPVRLGQVMTNLLTNGIRFTSNSPVRKIELQYDISFTPPDESTCAPPRERTKPSAIKEGQSIYLYIAVKDTGPGLTASELDMLFRRFSQVSPKTHTVFGGSGLGLFVCRKITNLMGGRIEVVSEHGHGSTFRFFVEARACVSQTPAQTQVAKRPAAPTRQHTAHILDSTRMNMPGSNRKPHILIVEDNLINQTVLARQLHHIGFTSQVASNGLEALDKIRKVSRTDGTADGQSFDCVLMDVEMPIMDGLTAVRHLREEEAAGKLRHNAVIALTGNARQGQIEEAMRCGMDQVVIKPYRLDGLLTKIEDVIRGKPAPLPFGPA